MCSSKRTPLECGAASRARPQPVMDEYDLLLAIPLARQGGNLVKKPQRVTRTHQRAAALQSCADASDRVHTRGHG
jgi:hypothetical protein